jgi:putative transposase
LLTLATASRRPLFADERLTRFCVAELRRVSSALGFVVYVYCFMPDHLHLLAGAEGDKDLIDFVKCFKQRTGYWFKHGYQGGLKASPTGLWQRSYHDHILRSEESIEVVTNYILGNPVAAGLVTEASEYAYSGSFLPEDASERSRV